MPRAAYRHVLIIGIWADRQRASGRNDRLFLFLSFGRDLRLDLRGTSTTSDLEFAPPRNAALWISQVPMGLRTVGLHAGGLGAHIAL